MTAETRRIEDELSVAQMAIVHERLASHLAERPGGEGMTVAWTGEKWIVQDADGGSRYIDVSAWARAIIEGLQRKWRIRSTVMACRASMDDDEFLRWCEELLPLLVVKT